jgi:[acyl-carrier-protein] S-malonyltransferase
MSESLAIVFPGQGAQHVGMLGALAESFSEVKQTFEEACDVLGYDLWNLVASGPEEALNQTEVTQPAMLSAGVAIWRLLQEEMNCKPRFMAGHSLGEYTALVCSGAISFKDGLELVRLRAQFMQSAVPAGMGAMAAIMGLDDEKIRAICAQIGSEQDVSPANFNAPGQVVIAGKQESVELACSKMKEAGAKMAKMLAVSVPSHCLLMSEAAEKLAEQLENVLFNVPDIHVLHNVDAKPAKTADEIKSKLVQQLYSPVLWVKTVRTLADEGVSVILEAGPGKVLAGLNKRIVKEITTLPVFDPDSLQKALDYDFD